MLWLACRSAGEKVGFTESYEAAKITSNTKEEEDVDISDVKEAAVEVVKQGKELTKEDDRLKYPLVHVTVSLSAIQAVV